MTVFESNRGALLRAMGAAFPKPNDDDVLIRSFIFIDGNGIETEIPEVPENLFGRFYLQFVIDVIAPDSHPTELEWTRSRRVLTEVFFAENWADKYVEGRQMLKALDVAVRIERIEWKS
jgi:hypothetical protein